MPVAQLTRLTVLILRVEHSRDTDIDKPQGVASLIILHKRHHLLPVMGAQLLHIRKLPRRLVTIEDPNLNRLFYAVDLLLSGNKLSVIKTAAPICNISQLWAAVVAFRVVQKQRCESEWPIAINIVSGGSHRRAQGHGPADKYLNKPRSISSAYSNRLASLLHSG